MKYISKMTMFVSFLFIVFFTLFPVTSFASEKVKILKVGMANLPPFGWLENKKVVGYVTEMANHVFKKMNVKTDIKIYPYVRGLHFVEQGELDCFLTSGKTPGKEKYAYFSEEKCTVNHWGFFILKKNKGKLKYEKLEDLKGKWLGYVRGYWIPPDIKKYIDENCNMRLVSVDEKNIYKLAYGRLDFAISEYNLGKHVADKLGVMDKIHFLKKKMLVSNNVYTIFSKKTMSPEFAEKYSEILKKFKASTEHDELKKKYGIKNSEETSFGVPTWFFVK